MQPWIHALMLLFACDEEGEPLSALHACSGMDYRCLECGQSVRLRRSKKGLLHFFHLLDQKRHCRRARRSLEHLMVQKRLETTIGAPSLQLERRFPELGRIADCCWEEEKIVFEIQCSKMSCEELDGRARDYASLGFSLVWILHERCYNRLRYKSIERQLAKSPFRYYTNIDEAGEGVIYDQWEWWTAGGRRRRYLKLPIDPKRLQRRVSSPAVMENRMKPLWSYLSESSFYFGGDLSHLLFRRCSEARWDQGLETMLTFFLSDQSAQAAGNSSFKGKFLMVKKGVAELWDALLRSYCR